MGEDTAASSFITDAQILNFLNEAQRKICWEGNVILTCATASTVASQEHYSVPTDYIKIHAVFLYRSAGAQLKLTPISLNSRDPRKTTGDPQFYYIAGINVSGANSPDFGLNPIPSSSGSADLEIYFTQSPLAMVNGGQAPEVQAHWQDALVPYALWKTYLRAGKEYLPMAQMMRQEWQDWVTKARQYSQQLRLDSPQTIQDTAGYLNVVYA